MNRRDLHYVRTEYEPGVACDCACNAYEWRFCERHKVEQDRRHAEAIEQHAEASALKWTEG